MDYHPNGQKNKGGLVAALRRPSVYSETDYFNRPSTASHLMFLKKAAI
jgi:hypothetical protein